MDFVFRWYGESDPVSLQNIRQIPCMKGIVTAVYDVPAGEIWPVERIASLKKQIEESGLSFKVVESVPVHEDIKLGIGDCERYINNYCENIKRLGKAGVEVICYNFMPVFDWLRSDLKKPLPDGSFSLAYDDKNISAIDLTKSSLSLPGWDESYTSEQLGALLEKYKNIDEEKLWINFARFINAVIPVCEEYGVKMAIHPDDPPWAVFGLPRIIKNDAGYERLVSINDSQFNGITLCSGSLGADPNNSLTDMINKYRNRIHFVHLRNILLTDEHSFQETAHPSECGSLDIYSIIKALYSVGFDGYLRPDHGRMIWGEEGKPGYGLFDRALGASYLSGLWEAINKAGSN